MRHFIVPDYVLQFLITIILLEKVNSLREILPSDGRSKRTTIYREEFETYETVQRRTEDNTMMRDGRRRHLQPGEKIEGRSKTRYMEFAETEFSRPSFYLPLPYLAPPNNRVQIIPARTLNQLIRQHIARNRIIQLAVQNPNYLRGSNSRLMELRQTPFRRWPTNSSVMTYEEKRRQWKMGLKKLKGNKTSSRIIPPLLISGGGHSSIQTDTEPDNRYFVTYSPQTHTYQVSRRPPPYLYTTNQDIMPDERETEVSRQLNPELNLEKNQSLTTVSPLTYEELSTTTEETVTMTSEAGLTTTMETMEATTTTSPSPLLAILQHAQLVANSERPNEHKQFVEAVPKAKPSPLKPIKQILFLDDYDQIRGEDADDPDSDVVARQSTTISTMTMTPTANPSVSNANLSEENRRKELGRAREKLREEFKLKEDDGSNEFIVEENEDEDLFFFKPGGRHQPKQEEEDPFRIMVHDTHDTGKRKL